MVREDGVRAYHPREMRKRIKRHVKHKHGEEAYDKLYGSVKHEVVCRHFGGRLVLPCIWVVEGFCGVDVLKCDMVEKPREVLVEK